MDLKETLQKKVLRKPIGLLAYNSDKNVIILNTNPFEVIKTIKSDKKIYTLIQLNEHIIFTVSGKNNTFWDIDKPKGNEEIKTFLIESSNFLAKINDNTIASANKDGTISILNINEEKARILRGHEKTVTYISKITNNIIASGDVLGTIIFWDITKEEKEQVNRFDNEHSSWIAYIIKVGNTIISGSEEETILWNVDEMKTIKTLIGDDIIFDLPVEINNNTIVYPSGNELIIFDLKSNKKIKTLIIEIEHENNDKIPYFSSIIRINDHMIASASEDGKIAIWDIDKPQSEEKVKELKESDNIINNLLKITERGDIIASISKLEIIIWNIKTGKKIYKIKSNEQIRQLIVLGRRKEDLNQFRNLLKSYFNYYIPNVLIKEMIDFF